ncbi:MAG: hypothetical protein KGL39_34255 [Patescibacteria group bacterium]|nr:hypothetical protein [Patescibacteria group bacterium]
MDEIIEPATTDDTGEVEAPAPDPAKTDEELLKSAKDRFKQAYQFHQLDFEACEKVQDFIAGEQWPDSIKRTRLSMERPCLVLDHLNQYVRHVVNSGLMQAQDVRVLAMSGEADDRVAEILAGMIRQITQTSTAKVAYETGLRHGCQVGFGYWRVQVKPVEGSDLNEITIRKIRDPRMVLMDPFCDYPDGRDAAYCFVLSKLTKEEAKRQYPNANTEELGSWQQSDSSKVLPWVGEGTLIIAEYYYFREDGRLCWAVLTPDKILEQGEHHGNAMPIIRVVGEEYEHDGRERKRGMINDSSMDAQRAYNYSSSAFIEAVALAPLAPFVAAEGQIEQYQKEWEEAHRTPRASLRYKPTTVAGQLVPPPARAEPAGIPAGWQGMMTNLISDTQMIMGLAQPSVLGTGGAPVQSGAGINAQQEPGEINTFHYQEHWHMAIEQTGRVILAMIPHVYTAAQAVKIVGDDGKLRTALLNPQQGDTLLEMKDDYQKVLSTSYNPNIGRYDVAISTGPSSATKKMEANKLLMTAVNAFPQIMEIAGDLVVGSFDMAGADVLAKRLKALLPPGTTEEPSGQVLMLKQAQQQMQEMQAQLADLQQAVLAEREKSQAMLAEAQLQYSTALQEAQLKARADLFTQRLDDQSALQLASIKAHTELETTMQNNIVKVLIAKLQAESKLDIELLKQFTAATQAPDQASRLTGYAQVLDGLQPHDTAMIPTA